jgi:hypothetical protein
LKFSAITEGNHLLQAPLRLAWGEATMSNALKRSMITSFNEACNAKDLAIAEKLFAILEVLLADLPGQLAKAQERLWLLRNLPPTALIFGLLSSC